MAEFAGDDRSVADYLVGEVLDRQPEEEHRSFLLQTCIVEELTGDLADALTGGHDGDWTLARLERANAFVAALGPRRGAYRYHQLFAGLLRCELRRQAPDQVAGLHPARRPLVRRPRDGGRRHPAGAAGRGGATPPTSWPGTGCV